MIMFVRVQPDDVGAIINVARTLRSLNETTEAEKWFYHAIDFIPTKQNIPDPTVDKRNGPSATRMNPNYLYAFISLANMIKEDPKRIEEADKVSSTKFSITNIGLILGSRSFGTHFKSKEILSIHV